MRYRPGTNQYTERDEKKSVQVLSSAAAARRISDILVTRTPAYQLGDGRDLPHQGFRTFVDLMDKYHPRYLLHGHVHLMAFSQNGLTSMEIRQSSMGMLAICI